MGNFHRVSSENELVYFFGTSKHSGRNLPSISVLNVKTGNLRDLFLYALGDEVNYANIVASAYGPSGNLKLIIEKVFLTEEGVLIPREYRLVELDPGYKILNEVRLPTDSTARLYETKFGFLDGIPLRLSSYSVSPNLWVISMVNMD